MQVQLAQVWVDDNDREHQPDTKVNVDQATAVQLIQDGRARIPDDVKVDRTRTATQQVLDAIEATRKKPAAKAAPRQTAAKAAAAKKVAGPARDTGSTAPAGERSTSEGAKA